jgi:hypothetical protein
VKSSEWLDNTFNGEFMPLLSHDNYRNYFKNLALNFPTALIPLGWIMHRTDAEGQLPLWEKLDFSHIPAGTLSEVYEDYAHEKAPKKSQQQSVHFTPRHIARMMVRQAFRGVPSEIVSTASVLDPATGAAVFLSLAFRELARQHAIHNQEKWPDTKALRGILYNQLCGLDINFTALNLAALTLYLTAIELDENPVPPEKLRFEKPLIGSVLLNVSRSPTGSGTVNEFGSIEASFQLGKKFDVVIGNPPWTSLGLKDEGENNDTVDKGQPTDKFSREIGAFVNQCIVDKKLDASIKYAHPDKVPDIAFVWKATEWAKEDTGVISFIVHQRLLIKRTSSWKMARKALFSCLQVDGIINAGEFANHDKLIWPGIESPFCILFARNRKAPKRHRIQLLSLAVEPTLLSRRQIRLDPLATTTISIEDMDELPGGLVVRTKGNELDRALLGRWQARLEAVNQTNELNIRNLRRLPLTTIGRCLEAFSKGLPKRGFKTALKNTKTPEWFSQLNANTKELVAAPKERIAGLIKSSEVIQEFLPRPFKSSPGLLWYKPPFLLIRHTPGSLGELARTILVTPSEEDAFVLYPYAFIGVPIKDDVESVLYAKFISLWINSSLYSYFQTLTSTQFSFGIKVILNNELLDTPIMSMHQAIELKLTNPIEIQNLFDRLSVTDKNLQEEIDSWVYKIIGVDAHEKQLIQDTLSISYPIGPSRNIGRHWVTQTIVEKFIISLKHELVDEELIDTASISVLPQNSVLPGWRFVIFKSTHAINIENDPALYIQSFSDEDLIKLVRENYPNGEVWGISKDNWFIYGQLALQRLWVPSRACITAQMISAWAGKFIS